MANEFSVVFHLLYRLFPIYFHFICFLFCKPLSNFCLRWMCFIQQKAIKLTKEAFKRRRTPPPEPLLFFCWIFLFFFFSILEYISSARSSQSEQEI